MPISTKLLHDLCDLPTAAFREDRVYEYVEKWAAKRPEIEVEADRFGNRLLTLAGTDAKRPRLVLVAHTDHPAFVAGATDGKTLTAEFRGGVTAGNCEKARVRFFLDDGGEVSLKVKGVEADGKGRLKSATFKAKEPVPPGTVGMLDQGHPREEGDLFYARACDDLAGCASALTALDLLRKTPPAATVCVLLTRAEEVGFVGAIAAVKDKKLLKKTDRVISIETSAQQPAAQQGKGVVLRIGDLTSVFHSGFSYFLAQRGKALTESEKGFAFQRALMPGGTCEGTVFDAFGHVAAAVCVPLGNYHNMVGGFRHGAKKTGKVGPEFIHLTDWRNMVALFVDVAQNLGDFTGKHDVLMAKLVDRFEANKHAFTHPNQPLGA